MAPSTMPSPAPSTRTPAWIAALVLLAFVPFTGWVLAHAGVLGLLTLVRGEPWALQLFVDLVLACTVSLAWLVRDARARGIAAAPYVVLTLVAGSIGLLAYVVRRGVTPRRGT